MADSALLMGQSKVKEKASFGSYSTPFADPLSRLWPPFGEDDELLAYRRHSRAAVMAPARERLRWLARGQYPLRRRS